MTRAGLLSIVLAATFSILGNAGAIADSADVLQAIQQDLSRYRQPEYQFTQERRIAVLSRPVLSSGVLDFSADHGLCWQLQKPYATTLLIDAEGIFQIEKEQAPKRLMAGGNPVFETFSRVYLALFKGDVRQLQKDFELQPSMLDDGWTLELLPKADSPLSWLQVIEMSRTADRIHLILKEKNADQVDLAFTPVLSSGDAPASSECW